jgi:hypothetical protein
MTRWFAVAVECIVLGATLATLPAVAGTRAREEPAKWAPAVEPKSLSEHVQRGLAWLVKAQHKNGGWSQGEESGYMGHSLDNVRDTPNVADTCIPALALIRAGSTPRSGPHAKNVLAAVNFVCREIGKSDEESLFITDVRGTRVQMKLGNYIDTFLASLLLAEVSGQMPDARAEKRLAAAFHKVMDKIEKNQRPDGTWDDRGWAPVFQQSLASKAINRAAQAGAPASQRVLDRAERYARDQFDQKSGKFKGAGSAGVALYSSAANLGAMRDSDNTNALREQQARVALKTAKTAREREEAKRTLKRIAESRDDLQKAQSAVVRNLEDQRFVSGFGSNGGEEFLSYMNIGESLVVKGGSEWQKWDKSISENLNRIQNNDGSWTGHHCITGRTFCTAAALLVLTVDRAPVPVAAKIKRQ